MGIRTESSVAKYLFRKIHRRLAFGGHLVPRKLLPSSAFTHLIHEVGNHTMEVNTIIVSTIGKIDEVATTGRTLTVRHDQKP